MQVLADILKYNCLITFKCSRYNLNAIVICCLVSFIRKKVQNEVLYKLEFISLSFSLHSCIRVPSMNQWIGLALQLHKAANNVHSEHYRNYGNFDALYLNIESRNGLKM